MKLFVAILLCALALTAGCQSPFVRFITTGSPNPPKGKWQRDKELKKNAPYYLGVKSEGKYQEGVQIWQ